MIKSQEIIDSAIRVDQTKLKMNFIYFSIVLNTVLLEMNFTKKIANQIPNITQLPRMQATKKLMNSDNYHLNTQLLKFILRCLSLRNNLLSNESDGTHVIVFLLLHNYDCYKFHFTLLQYCMYL